MRTKDPKALRLERLDHEIPAQDVAAEIGVSPGTLSKWERRRLDPTDEQIKAWRRALAKLEKECT